MPMYAAAATTATSTTTSSFRPRGLAIHRDMLLKAEVIAQVAECFIVVKCGDDNTLCIFDQHAMHERVRLEEFLKKATSGASQQVIRQSPKPFKPLVLPSLTPQDLQLLQTPLARAFLAKFFLDFQVVGTSVIVRTRPLIIEEPLPDVTELLPALLRDLRGMQSHPGAGDPLQATALPPSVRNIFNSKSCRGAIMFHTKISRVTCQRLLQELAKTDFPFSCAHGRPSVVPLTVLEHNLLSTTTMSTQGGHVDTNTPLRFRQRGQQRQTLKADLTKLFLPHTAAAAAAAAAAVASKEEGEGKEAEEEESN